MFWILFVGRDDSMNLWGHRVLIFATPILLIGCEDRPVVDPKHAGDSGSIEHRDTAVSTSTKSVHGLETSEPVQSGSRINSAQLPSHSDAPLSEARQVEASPPTISREEFSIRLSQEVQDYFRREQSARDGKYLVLGSAVDGKVDLSAILWEETYNPGRYYQIRVNGIKILVRRDLVNAIHNSTIELDPQSNNILVQRSMER
jgi:hypothetical protein